MPRKKDKVPEHETLPPPSGEAWTDVVRSLRESSGSLRFVGETWDIVPIADSPCNQSCPAGINVKGYIGLIADRRFEDALSLIREKNPFPGICGRVCPHPCEDACLRAEFGGPVAIKALKRFVADYEARRDIEPEEHPPRTGEKVAIVGAGPAGLTAAADLARENCQVTVFEASSSPGGMMRWAIPAFRLPRNILKNEIEAIKALGVEIKLNSKLGKDFTTGDLKQQGFKAIFLAVGAGKCAKMKIPGESARGVIDALSFLRRASTGKYDRKKLGKRVVVIGGGNSAVDSARCALRLGAESVIILYRRGVKQMTALQEEIDEAMAEGVLIQYLAAPVRVITEDKHISKVECIHMGLGEPDGSGRRRPIPIEGSEFILDVDTLIPAIGQRPDVEGISAKYDIELTKWGTIKVDPETLDASIPGVVAGGDAVTGPATVVEAIGHGHVAARSILRFIKDKPLVPKPGFDRPAEVEVPNQLISSTQRIEGVLSVSERRRRSFQEVERRLKIEEAVKEAQRCLRCGPCSECRHCLASCPKEWVVLTSSTLLDRRYNLPLRADMHHTFLQPAAEAGGALHGKDGEGNGHAIPVAVTSLLAKIDASICRSCGSCLEVCAYEAPAPISRPAYANPYVIDEAKCKGCGSCVAVCPTSAIRVGFYTQGLYFELMDNAIKEATQ
jgi:NADPH-dependent glutamate synthase beta subunit-like oxidoreductase/NAD-dependent dihydropyrimidine dehydrogenase PreA subunit